MPPRSLTVGIDVGGTFTDLLAVDPVSNVVKLAKVPTTMDNQAIGFMAALAAAGVDPATLQAVVHGTTTTTNALLERKIATAGLITTKGFRDVLELGRRTRPQPYGMRGTFRPLIEREYRLEVPERMDADGKVLTPLDEAAVAEAAKKLLAMGSRRSCWHWAARPSSSISCTATSIPRTSGGPSRSSMHCGPTATSRRATPSCRNIANTSAA